jgi:hypothetical protein
MPNEQYYKEVDLMFAKHLNQGQDVCIRIKDVSKDEIVEDMNYNKVVFDHNLNIYKIKDGRLIPVDNPNFKAVIVSEK